MPRLVIQSGAEAGRQIELKPGLSRVGRHPDNDIVVNERSVSSCHCELELAEIALAVRDLGSTNGTFINGRQIAKGVLQRGDVLGLGDVELSCELEEVNIQIPQIPFEEAAGAAFLPDGTPACFHHREVPAAFRCTKCEEWWCGECVRLLKRLNGEFLQFCPECDAPCFPLPRETGGPKKGFLGRVGDTLRITRKKSAGSGRGK